MFSRPLSSSGYTFRVEVPEKRSIFSEIEVPYSISKITPFKGLEPSQCPTPNPLFFFNAPEKTCVLSGSELVTYNHKKHDCRLVYCWTKTAFDVRSPEDFIVYSHIQRNSQPEAKVVIPKDDIYVVFSKNRAFVSHTLF